MSLHTQHYFAPGVVDTARGRTQRRRLLRAWLVRVFVLMGVVLMAWVIYGPRT